MSRLTPPSPGVKRVRPSPMLHRPRLWRTARTLAKRTTRVLGPGRRASRSPGGEESSLPARAGPGGAMTPTPPEALALRPHPASATKDRVSEVQRPAVDVGAALRSVAVEALEDPVAVDAGMAPRS